jgi:TPR repeat protein
LGKYYLGYAYNFGEGVEKSYPDALKWHLLSADQCNSWAMNNLGIMYERGLGVKQDSERAFCWYWKSAAGGNAWAECNLGISYYWGRGVKKISPRPSNSVRFAKNTFYIFKNAR